MGRLTGNLPLLAAAIALCLSAAPAAAQTAEPERFVGSWKITCEGGPCRAFVNISQDEEVVVAWTVVRNPETGGGTSLIKVPTGVALPPGLRVYTDDDTVWDAAFQVCQPDGCTAVLPMDDGFISAIAERSTARVAFIRYGQPRTTAYEVPVDQLAEALETLRDL